MPNALCRGPAWFATIGLSLVGGLWLVGGAPAPAGDGLALDDGAMGSAIGFFESVAGAPIGDDDAAWLRERWAKAFEKTPREVVAEIDRYALRQEVHRRDGEPIALAAGRSELIDGAYCAAAQTGDPDIHRLRDIFAPKEAVLAADCAFGLVVTRFDLEGMVASHGLMASIAGLAFDAERNRTDVLRFIESEFDGSPPETKALMANGELRHAVTRRFWSKLEGDPRKGELTVALEGQAVDDLPAAARNLETLAVQELSGIDAIAEAGGHRLTSAGMSEYFEFLEPIAGGGFSYRDRLRIQDLIVAWFLEDPARSSEAIASLERTTRDHLIESDPARQDAMADAWAAGLHCDLVGSDDPRDRELMEIVFRDDPVVASDCDAGRIQRHHDTVLAEAAGLTLTEGDLRTSLDWMAFILGRQVTADEAAFDRDYMLKAFDEDPAHIKETLGQVQPIFAEYERKDLDFLQEEYRRTFVIASYCRYLGSDDEDDRALIEMFHRNNEFLHVDCENEAMTMRVDIDGAIGSLDFLATLAGVPPFTAEERAELHEAWADEDMTYGWSNRLALAEWWSMLDFAARQDVISRLQAAGFSHAADATGKVREWLDHAKLTAVVLDAKRDQCEMMAVISAGQTAIYAAKAGGHVHTDPSRPGGMMGAELSHLIPMNNMFAAFCS